MKIKSLTLASMMFASTLFTSTVFADDASRLALANEIATYEAEHTNYDTLVQDAADSTLAQMAQAGMPAATPEQREKVRALYKEKLIIPLKNLTLNSGPIYAQIYSEEELTAMLAFNKTPLGTSILEKTPALAAAMRQAMMDLMATTIPTLMPELMAILQTK